MKFLLSSKFKPAGSQPEAIKKLAEGFSKGFPRQTLLGVTGSGKSLDYGEFVFLKNDAEGIIKILIGEFVEKHLIQPKVLGDTLYQEVMGCRVISFNDNYAIGEREIIEVSKHKEKDVYEIILDDYSTIKVTKDHNCFRFSDCKFELCRTSELLVGDYLPTATTFLSPEKNIDCINLLDYNPNYYVCIGAVVKKYDFSGSKIFSLLKGNRAPSWKINQILSRGKSRGVSAGFLYAYLNALNLKLTDVNDSISIITNHGDMNHPLLRADDNFLTFAGLYVAEGHNAGRYILMSNSDKKLQRKCMAFAKTQGMNYNVRNKSDIQYNSIILSNFFKIFGSTARHKRIPSLAYNFSNRQLSIFLRAVFDGDGWVELGGVCLTSASRELVYDLKNLLLRFKITSRITINKGFYRISIYGRDNLLRFRQKICFSITYKKLRLSKIIRPKGNTNVDLIPNIAGFVKKLREEHCLSQKDFAKICNCQRSHISFIENGLRKPSKRIFSKLVSWLQKKNSPQSCNLKNFLEFNFRRITSIKKIASSNGWVYDLSVSGNENFAAGYGNIFVHNTFTMAHVIQELQVPTLVLSHNKTLASQLYYEFRDFFPKNRVEYFISYYDYYQPESYIPQTDQYIEKDSSINPKIEQMRLAATAALLSRKDTIIVSSISCIYGLGSPENFGNMGFEISLGQKISRSEILKKLVSIQFERNDVELLPGRFRVKGDVVDFIPGYSGNIIRIEMFGDEIEKIIELDRNTGNSVENKEYFFIYPARHFVVPEESKEKAIESIKKELEESLPRLGLLEAHRLKQRTLYDIEMIEETGYCKGIENYSRHFDGRKPGEKPYCLLDYFPKDFLFIIDESHQSIPQSRAMYNGDRSRKQALVDYGFRLPSAFDNRPLKFSEFEKYLNRTLFVSATPSEYEFSHSGQVAEQIIRPTGLVDPPVEVRPIKGQIDDVKKEIGNAIARGDRALVTTLTKKLAEELAEHLSASGVKTRYLHSDIDVLERTEIVRELRLGKFDVLVGINLLREGLDIPEVGFIAIFDADKEGFLRDEKSLIQIIGRAARNINSRVVLYADKSTESMRRAIAETKRRRELQLVYNKKHKIIPKTIIKPIREKEVEIKDIKHIPKAEIPAAIIELEAQMQEAADNLEFEKAIALRDRVKELKTKLGE